MASSDAIVNPSVDKARLKSKCFFQLFLRNNRRLLILCPQYLAVLLHRMICFDVKSEFSDDCQIDFDVKSEFSDDCQMDFDGIKDLWVKKKSKPPWEKVTLIRLQYELYFSELDDQDRSPNINYRDHQVFNYYTILIR